MKLRMKIVRRIICDPALSGDLNENPVPIARQQGLYYSGNS